MATLTFAQALERTIAVYDCMARDAQEGCGIVVGMSFGGYLGAMLAAERQVHALALRSPALYPDDHLRAPKASLDEAALRQFRAHPPEPDANRALAACRDFRGTSLLVTCARDEVIPAAVTDRYAECLGHGRLQTQELSCADHGLSEHAWRIEYSRVLRAWLRERVIPRHLRAANSLSEDEAQPKKNTEQGAEVSGTPGRPFGRPLKPETGP